MSNQKRITKQEYQRLLNLESENRRLRVTCLHLESRCCRLLRSFATVLRHFNGGEASVEEAYYAIDEAAKIGDKFMEVVR